MNSTADTELSPIQRALLQRALGAGYFDTPRQTSLVHLAAEVGISEAAASAALREGLDTVLRDAGFGEEASA